MTTGTKNHGSRRRNMLSLAARILVSAIVLCFVVTLVQWKNIVAAFHTADGRSIAAAGGLLFFNIGIRTYKWRIMLRSVKEAPTLSEAFGSVMLGISLGSFTPGEIGEFAGRAVHIADAKQSLLVGLTLLDKVQLSIVTGCAGLASLAWMTINHSLMAAVMTFLLMILAGMVLMNLGNIALVTGRLPFSFLQKSWLKNVLEGFRLLQRQQICVTVLFTWLYYAVLILQMYFLLNAFADITLVHALIGHKRDAVCQITSSDIHRRSGYPGGRLDLFLFTVQHFAGSRSQCLDDALFYQHIHSQYRRNLFYQTSARYPGSGDAILEKNKTTSP